jgi:hypothetical protein
MPIGISPGIKERERLSQINEKIPPMVITIGILLCVSLLIIIREKFGTINPIHPTIPEMAIIDEVNKTEQIKTK